MQSLIKITSLFISVLCTISFSTTAGLSVLEKRDSCGQKYGRVNHQGCSADPCCEWWRGGFGRAGCIDNGSCH